MPIVRKVGPRPIDLVPIKAVAPHIPLFVPLAELDAVKAERDAARAEAAALRARLDSIAAALGTPVVVEVRAAAEPTRHRCEACDLAFTTATGLSIHNGKRHPQPRTPKTSGVGRGRGIRSGSRTPEILRRHTAGERAVDIAAAIGISRQAVSAVLKRYAKETAHA